MQAGPVAGHSTQGSAPPWLRLDALDGRRALVTGASRGIGAAIAELLASAGADVHLVARDPIVLDAVVQRLAASSGRTITFTAADVATRDGCATVCAAVAATGLDILVNNAGGTAQVPVLDLSDDDIDSALSLNLLSVMRLCRDLAPALRDGGRIVNIGSIAVREPHPNTAHYAAAKAGMLAYSKALSSALGPRRITVNVVLPGLTLTPQTERELATEARRLDLEPEVVTRRILGRRQALRRAGEPAEVAAAVGFLVSDAASWITGAALPVDGGSLQGLW